MKNSKICRPSNTNIGLNDNVPQKIELYGFEGWIRIVSIQSEVILDKGYLPNMKYMRKLYQGILATTLEDSFDFYFPFEKEESLDWSYLHLLKS